VLGTATHVARNVREKKKIFHAQRAAAAAIKFESSRSSDADFERAPEDRSADARFRVRPGDRATVRNA
jgi:hypothetical protein